MPTKDTPSPAILNELLRYDPETGHFFRRDSGRQLAESLAGRYGRIQIHIAEHDVMRYAARVAWAMTYGVWPVGQVDHIDEDHTNNRLANLREATNAQNKQNCTRSYSTNGVGLRGVSQQSSGTWRARITIDGATTNIGTFATAQEAADAYLRAKREMHPFWSESASSDPVSNTSRLAA